ncbi:helix-turn-helix domain-containing protein [Nocardia salmonicida]|uniref:PucR family transcriptional regulator n=1 Tax=Nocardia salmonicida TaxID=53431 RepID=UPI00343141EC
MSGYGVAGETTRLEEELSMEERERNGTHGQGGLLIAPSPTGKSAPPAGVSSGSGTAGSLGPAAISLRDTRSLAEEMVRHFRLTVARCLTLPDEALRGDITAVTVNCLRIATTILDGRGAPTEREVAQLESAAAQWARGGVPIDVILHALHEGSKMAHELVASRSAVDSVAECVDIGARTVDLLDLMTTTVTMAYLREYRGTAHEHRGAVNTFTTALLSGRVTTAMARECGLSIAEHYHLLALSILPSSSGVEGGVDRRAASGRVIRRIRADLAERGGKEVLSLLSNSGGTILIPSTALPADQLEPLVRVVAEAADAVVTAVHLEVAVDAIPQMSPTLHDMVDVANRLTRVLSAEPETRLYDFAELAAEYQLTRPGAVRESMARRLDPLVANPLLLRTLTVYMLSDQNRQRAARRLFIHPNTIDHRLKRIAGITGLDPARADGQWGLRAALVARAYRSETANPGVDTVETGGT